MRGTNAAFVFRGGMVSNSYFRDISYNYFVVLETVIGVSLECGPWYVSKLSGFRCDAWVSNLREGE